MANGLKHKTQGTVLTQAEYEEEGTGHIFDSQATGDIAYASSSTVIRRLAIGSNTAVMTAASGIPAWNTNIAIATNGQLTANAGVVVDNITIDGTTIALSSGTLTLDVAANIELDAAAGIWIFEDGGTEVLRFTESNTGDVTIKLVTNAKDLIFTDNGDAEGFRILDAAVGVKVPGKVQTTGLQFTDADPALTIADGGGVTFPVSIDITGSVGIILENDETITNSTDGTVLINGILAAGTGSAAGTFISNGNQDLLLKTGNATTGSITITDGANGDINLTPNGTGEIVADSHIALVDGHYLEVQDTTPGTDETVSGIVMVFTAGEAVSKFQAVYMRSDGEVGPADSSATGTMPAIGVAIEAASDGGAIRVLTHGILRDDSSFGSNMTEGGRIYVSETAGAMTQTAPSDDGDMVQIIGIATGDRTAFIAPSLTMIELA